MTGRTLPDDCRYPPASDAQIEEMQDRIAEYSAGDKTIATRIDWLGSFRRLLPMYWKYKQAAEYWKSWQDPDKIKSLEAENANLLAITQGQREEMARRPRVGSCVWVSLDSDMDTRIWSTGCKQEWIFHAGSPQENGVKFCPHCGAEAEIQEPQD